MECTICGNDPGHDETITFGDDIVCAECKDIYVQCLKEGTSPFVTHSAWRHKNAVMCEEKADLSKACITCSEKVDGRLIRLYYFLPRTTWLQLMGPMAFITIGYCQKCYQKRLLKVKVKNLPFVVLIGSAVMPSFFQRLGMPITNYLGHYMHVVVCAGILLMLTKSFWLKLPTASVLKRSGLVKVKYSGTVFMERLPERLNSPET